MLILTAQNISEGEEPASYRVCVYANRKLIWKEEVDGHNRGEGWPRLLELIATKAGVKVTS